MVLSSLVVGGYCWILYLCIDRCELCSGLSVSPPLAAHMRRSHVGCSVPSTRGYDRSGLYKRIEPLPDPAPTDLPQAVCGRFLKGKPLYYNYK